MARLPTLLLLVVLSVAAVCSAGPLQNARVPRFAHAMDGGVPLWVSESLAVVDGRIQSDFFDAAFLRRLERNVAKNQSQCTSYLSLGPLHVADDASIEDRVGLSYSVITGLITAAEQGFYRGTPGTAYALSVSGRPKSFGHATTTDVLYIFVARADIRTARGHLCSTPVPGTPIPEVGDRVVVFAQTPAQDEDREFLLANGRSGLVLERRGLLIGQVELKMGRARELQDVLNAVSRSGRLSDIPERRVK